MTEAPDIISSKLLSLQRYWTLLLTLITKRPNRPVGPATTILFFTKFERARNIDKEMISSFRTNIFVQIESAIEERLIYYSPLLTTTKTKKIHMDLKKWPIRRFLHDSSMIKVRVFFLIILNSCSLALKQCCMINMTPTDRISCINSSIHSREIDTVNQSRIALAVFISENIYEYAAYSLLTMSHFALERGYYLRILSPLTGDDYDPLDRRWNKIMGLITALNPTYGWAKNFDVLVLVDADLIVIDFSLKIEDFIDRYPQANLIMSADALDVANTGFIIAKNSQWTVKFFQKWWKEKGTKFTFCDQHVFNKLYG